MISFQNNILVTDDGVACLCDFGLANILETVGPTFATSVFAGSVRWMAPELVISSVDSQSKPISHSFSTDVYSFGCVAYQVCIPVTAGEFELTAIPNLLLD